MVCPHSGWVLPLQLNPSENTLVDDAPSIQNPVNLTISVKRYESHANVETACLTHRQGTSMGESGRDGAWAWFY